MEVEAESTKKENVKEFESLLKEDLKKRVLVENSIIEGFGFGGATRPPLTPTFSCSPQLAVYFVRPR